MVKIFISATSRDLKSYRQVVADWAKARGYDVVVQDDFEVQPDFVTVVRLLREKIDPCDAVIHLAGFYYGFEPANVPANELRRSYTQLEFELGRELKRQVVRFLADEGCPFDNAYAETEEKRELQRRHCERLRTGDALYYSFASADDLRAKLEQVAIRPTVMKPHNLPFDSLGSLFKGREAFLEQLRRTLVNKPTHIMAVTAKQAIHGLGGVGKTRAAIEYAWQFATEYTALLFVTADSPASFEQNLAALCGAMVLDLPEQTEREQAVQLKAVVRWLREHAGWFLIVDNVDTAAAAQVVERQLLNLSNGHVVVTSRLSDWGAGVEVLELDVLDRDPAADFLLERTHGKRPTTPTDAAAARHLADDLGCLALALEQAGAFIAKHRCTFADYRTRWKKQETKVLTWFDERAMHYPRSVAVTWQTTLEQLSAEGLQLLRVLCWLAPDPIPTALVKGLDDLDGETAVADLATYSLLKWDADHTGVRLHRLVQDVTRFRTPPEERHGWIETALKMVNGFAVGDAQDVRTWNVYEAARPHALAVTDHAQTIGNPKPTSRLLNQLGVTSRPLSTMGSLHMTRKTLNASLEPGIPGIRGLFSEQQHEFRSLEDEHHKALRMSSLFPLGALR